MSLVFPFKASHCDLNKCHGAPRLGVDLTYNEYRSCNFCSTCLIAAIRTKRRDSPGALSHAGKCLCSLLLLCDC